KEYQFPPEKEDQTIIITQFLSPHQFSYVMMKDVMAYASPIHKIEETLVKHLTKDKNKRIYLVNQKVFVLYKPGNPPKLLRGVVKKCQDDEYVVWISDYGFTLCCSSLDMWPLPETLTISFYKIKDGGIAHITPANNNWSKSSLRVFDKLLEDAKELNFEVVCHSKENRYLGKLMYKTASQSAVFHDGAEYLVTRMQACRDILKEISELSDAFSFELAEINDPLIEARPRVKNIIQLVSSFSNSAKNSETIYNNLSFDISKVSGSRKSNLSGSLERSPLMDKTFDFRLDVHVPKSGKIMRKKVFVSHDGCVESALIKNNQSNEKKMTNEDVQPPFDDNFWANYQLAKRSASSDTSSEESFRTMNSSPTLSSDSSDDYESSEVLNPSRESLSTSERIKSTSDRQKESKTVGETLSSSASSEASFCTVKNEPFCSTSSPLASENRESSFVDDKLGRIHNETLQPKDDLHHIVENGLQNVSKATKSKNQWDHASMAVLAHSCQTVNPVDGLAHLPFCQEVRRSMSDLNIHTMLPMQLYSWPHLLKGGSIVLINDCGKGRTWSYLPVLCSSVLGSLQSAAYSRDLKLGPLAILLVDSMDRAKALTNICVSLMSSSDTHMLKVVNTHGQPLPICQMMLLNSCGILVTKPKHLLDLLDQEISVIDPKRLEFIIIDDFDRLQKATSKGLDEVMKKLKGMPTGPKMQFIMVAQQWHAKQFEKLLKNIRKPLVLFENFLEAAMYGGLKLKFSLKESSMKADQLLMFLSEQKASSKRILIYCNDEIELTVVDRILTNAGYEWIGLSEAQNQLPHKLMLVSDQLELPRMAVQNIEVVIHYSLPNTWSKFTDRFSVMADQIPNYFKTMPKNENKQPLLSYLLLDMTNSRQFERLTEFIRAHGFNTDDAPWMNCVPQVDDSIPYCPYFLSTGECVMVCQKRHHFTPADMPPARDPLQQEGTVIRCKLCKVYDPGHMAVWPVQFQSKGSTEWLDAPYPAKKWIPAIEMSMGTKQNVHNPYRLGEVCIVRHQEYFKRVKIVDIQTRGQVTVQIMDYGTELLRVYARHLLQCPDQKFRDLPSLAMDIRLTGVTARDNKGLADTTQWVQQSLSEISDSQQMQITVDFAMLNVVYAKEVTLVEECPKMGTGVYKLLLRNELVKRGCGQTDSQSDLLRQMHKNQKKANDEVERNKENKGKAIHSEDTKTYPSPQKIEPKEPSNIPMINKANKPEPMIELVDPLAKIDCEPKELPSTKTIKIDTSNENNAPSSPEAGLDQLSSSTGALCHALMQELGSMSPPEKQDTHLFLQSILEGIEATNYKKPSELGEFKLKDAPKEASQGPSDKPVSQSLLFSKISKGAVRPRVKWYQTKLHIDLTIEQQVPEYELWLVSKSLIYNVSTISPPQNFVLPLLGEVRLVSQKQHGYYLKIRLAKVGILEEWPTLLDSVYAQKHSPWLTYDLERAEESSPPPGLVMWDRYSRHQVNKDDYSSDDEELSTDFFDPGVEGSDSGEICDD
ncbi:hypothetical protein KR038_001186, partial [Drosophila bunnanda]